MSHNCPFRAVLEKKGAISDLDVCVTATSCFADGISLKLVVARAAGSPFGRRGDQHDIRRRLLEGGWAAADRLRFIFVVGCSEVGGRPPIGYVFIPYGRENTVDRPLRGTGDPPEAQLGSFLSESVFFQNFQKFGNNWIYVSIYGGVL